MLLPRLFTTPAVFWAMLVLSASSILADTEIRNFHLPLPPSTRSIHPSTQILDIPLPTSPQVLNVSNSSPELWIRTPLEGYASWTARISWPASTPTKFEMEVLPDPESSIGVIVHLSAALLSPRFPRHPFKSIPSGHLPISDDEFYATFALVIEPLILGVLPKTAVSAIGWILVFGLGAAYTVPTIIRYLDSFSRTGKVKRSGSEKRKSI